MSATTVVAVKLPSSGVSTPQNQLPNLAVYTTQGYNLKTGGFASAAAFEQSFTNGKTAQYTVDGKTGPYEVPDQIFYDPSHNGTYQSVSSSIIQNQADYSSYVANSVSLGGSYEIASVQASASTVYSQNIAISSSQTYGLNFGGAVVFSVARNLPTSIPASGYLTTGFAAALNALTPSSSQAEFAAFFDEYGTHYLKSGCFGGSYLMVSSIETSAISTMTSSQVSTALTAGFNDVVASGSLSVTALDQTGSAVSSFSSSSSFSFFTMGGQPVTTIDSFIGGISSDPVLLMNPSVAPKAVVGPMTDLMAAPASAAMVAAYQQALSLYLNPALSVIGQPTVVTSATVVQAETDGVLSAFAYMLNNGDRGQFTLATDSSLNPTMIQAMGSMHQYSGNGIIVPSGNGVTPVRKGDCYNVVYTPTAGEPHFAAAFTPFTFPPGVALGSWSTPITSTVAKTVTATAATDLFVCVTLQEQNDGDRGYVTGSINGTQVAAASMHWFMADDIHVPYASFMMPVPQGASYSVDYTPTAINPLATITTIPLLSPNGPLLQAPAPLSANTTYTASTDGFVISFLNAAEANGSRGVMQGFAGSAAGQPASTMVANSSVHYYIADDVYVPYNSFTFPVTRGAEYTVSFTNTAVSTACSVFWIGLSV